ncbi:hypothetical protein E3E12_07855 [Formicincola oecophyllae]|uniref:Uncharacterized protein n=1 Tax=Formicincola oecophyllae TaxID=2558361 RepID=A0A4Y6UAY6_9PROT|nr:hypothetical protein [Formicincola oecophyllae]QDH14110.1 hypothetical protein E3E12_07855 [Formicincola oecophyllae]
MKANRERVFIGDFSVSNVEAFVVRRHEERASVEVCIAGGEKGRGEFALNHETAFEQVDVCFLGCHRGYIPLDVFMNTFDYGEAIILDDVPDEDNFF